MTHLARPTLRTQVSDLRQTVADLLHDFQSATVDAVAVEAKLDQLTSEQARVEGRLGQLELAQRMEHANNADTNGR